jgi:hypothetical protein
MFEKTNIRSFHMAFFSLCMCIGLAGCGSTRMESASSHLATQPAVPVAAMPNFGPVVLENGQCSEGVSFDLNALKVRQTDESLQGISECELVALKGMPLSVQTGSSSNSKRETTMLYMETMGKAVYLFSDNKLARVIRAAP